MGTMMNPRMPPIMTAPGLLANDTVCYPGTMVTTNGIWVHEDPLLYALPVFLLQILMIVLLTRLLMILFKPLNQPRFFCEFIAGMLLGPSAGGRIPGFAHKLFQKQSLLLLETIGNVGVIYFAFMMGLEMDMLSIKKNAKKAMTFALAGMFLPVLVSCAFSLYLYKITTMQEAPFMILFAVSLSVTALPVLTRVLGELRLLDTKISRLAKSAGLVNDVLAVVLLAFAISLPDSDKPMLASLWVLLSSLLFVGFYILLLRPAISWLIRHTSEEENSSNFTASIILTGVMFSSVLTDAIGIHPAVGGFVFGLIIPNGPLAVNLIEKLEDFLCSFLLPLFFATSGLKTNVYKINGVGNWVALILAAVLASAGKVAGTVLVALFSKMPFREGLALGFLMNAKGLVQLIALNFGKDQKLLDDTGYAMITITSIVMNAIITPIVMKVYKPARRLVPYKRRTIQKTKATNELRVLACIHTPRNVPTIINLLEASHATKKSPISVFSLHLVELTGHASATIIDHSSQKSDQPAMNRMQAQSEHIINAFETFGQHASSVTVQSLTAISPYSTMHEEICNLAEDKRIAFIIVPFHKQQTVDGGMEAANPKFRMVNQNLLTNAPCSVGILVDRGLSGSTRLAANQTAHNIAVLFFGGPDDREALSYAVRLSEHPGNTLNVIRFVPGPNTVDLDTVNFNNEHGVLTLQIDKEKDKQLDDDHIKEFRMMKANDESFSYIEKVVNNGEETVSAIRTVDNIHDLLIVGRGEGTTSPLTAGLTEWSECPELGVIGDLLASTDFASSASVLVVQQYVGLAHLDEGIGTPDNLSQQGEDQYMMGSIRP